MTTNSINATPDAPFVTTFIPSQSGIQTKQRVQGRRAFPGRQRPQPKVGETWLVEVSGENPTHTVYFVKCIERVTTPVAVKEVEVPVSSDQEIIDRAQSWLLTPKKVDLSNLREGFSHRCIDDDAAATALRNELQGVMNEFETLSAQSKSIAGHLQAKYWWEDRDFAEKLYLARQVMDCRKREAKELQTQTLSYGRLVKKLNAQGETPDEELALKISAIKFALDLSREIHNQNMSRARVQLEEVEAQYSWLDIDKRVFCKGVEMKDLKIAEADQKSVDEILVLLKEKAGYEEQKAYFITQLESAVTALEARVAVIVKQ